MSALGSERRARLAGARLYLCTPIRDDLARFLDAVLPAGVDIVQLRDKDAPDDAIARASEIARASADRHGALFILNDRPDLAHETGADGVHVGQEDATPADARAAVGPDALVGLSTHAEDELARAHAEPIDYVGAGPVHATPTKPGRPGVGLSYLEAAARAAAVPWFVTGGMDVRTIPAAQRAGARRFVVVRAITEASDPAAATRAIRAAIDRVPLDG